MKREAFRCRFALQPHAEITAKACNGYLTFSQLRRVVNANLMQDFWQAESKYHFDNCAFSEGIAYIQCQWKTIEDSSENLSGPILAGFGRLLHSVQDFYSHSNWVELHLQSPTIPIWDLTEATLHEEIVSGRWPMGEPHLCDTQVPHHDEMNKDSPSSGIGGNVVEAVGPHQGKTLYSLAEAVATRATRRQLERLLHTSVSPTVDENLTDDIVRAGIADLVDTLEPFFNEIKNWRSGLGHT